MHIIVYDDAIANTSKNEQEFGANAISGVTGQFFIAITHAGVTILTPAWVRFKSA